MRPCTLGARPYALEKYKFPSFNQIPSRHFEFRVSLRVYCLRYLLGGAVFMPRYPDNAVHAHSRYLNCQGRKDIFSFSKLFYKLWAQVWQKNTIYRGQESWQSHGMVSIPFFNVLSARNKTLKFNNSHVLQNSKWLVGIHVIRNSTCSWYSK